MTNLDAYRPYWHPLALLEEISETPRRFTLLGEDLVGFRTSTGPVVLRDLCIHRGSALSLGKVVNDNIECPYHGWQYNTAGDCVRIPALLEGQPIPQKARTDSYQVREYAGLVWVALEDPIAPFPEWPAGCEFDNPALRANVVGGRRHWTAGAGRAIENFLDVSHFPFIHDGTLGSRDRTLIEEHEVRRDDHGMSFRYQQIEPEDPLTGVGEVLDLEYHFRVPLTGHLKRTNPRGEWTCISLLAAPTTATTSDLFLTCVRNFDLDPADDGPLDEFIDRVFEQDKAVVASVRPEQIPVDLREELHLRVPDAAGMIFRQLLGKIEGVGSVA